MRLAAGDRESSAPVTRRGRPIASTIAAVIGCNNYNGLVQSHPVWRQLHARAGAALHQKP